LGRRHRRPQGEGASHDRLPFCDARRRRPVPEPAVGRRGVGARGRRHVDRSGRARRDREGGRAPHRRQRRDEGAEPRGDLPARVPGRWCRVRPLIRVSLSTQRRALIGWGIGLAAIALMYAAVYPSIKQSAADLDKYMQNLPDAVRSIIGTNYTSPAGYLRAELFSLLGPVLLLVYGIGAGGKTIAGEEEARSLDLLITTPMPRGRVVADKAVTLALSLLALSALVFV